MMNEARVDLERLSIW